MRIVDSHAHFSECDSVMRFKESPENFVAQCDKVGCDYVIQAICVSLTVRPSLEYLDKKCKELYENSNGRVLSYIVYDPHYAEECLEIIEKCHNRPYFVGIKLHPSYHWSWADGESYRPAWEAADKYNLPIMSHTWAMTSNPKQKFSTPDKFEKYIKEYPNVTFIFGHSGGRTAGIKEAAAIGAKYKNTYFDLAGDIYNRKLIEYLVEHVGADRVMIASDIGWFDLSMPMGMVLGTDLTLEEKEMILGGNAMRIFRIQE